jgi:hypothetical protein
MQHPSIGAVGKIVSRGIEVCTVLEGRARRQEGGRERANDNEEGSLHAREVNLF